MLGKMQYYSSKFTGFRTRGLFSAFGTEVLCLVPLLDSVPKACFLLFGRKFRTLYPCWLPYQSPIFCILDGSIVLCTLADFRIQGLFSVFWTEVSCPAVFPSSVPEARFQCFVRKYRVLQSSRLPYQRPVFSVLYGSFLACAPTDFRTFCPFPVFWTEVLCLICLLTSVSKACFQCFGRKYRALQSSRLPYQRPVFSVLYGSFVPCSLPDFLTGSHSLYYLGFFLNLRCRGIIIFRNAAVVQ